MGLQFQLKTKNVFRTHVIDSVRYGKGTLPGRYRCVNCLSRFELRSVCPNCGEHSTIVRMSDTSITTCASSASDAYVVGRT